MVAYCRIFVLSVLACLSGCVPVPYIALSNRANDTLLVVSDEQAKKIPPEQTVTFRLPTRTRKLRITHNSRAWCYDLPKSHIPLDYWRFQWFRSTAYLEIDALGNVVVLDPRHGQQLNPQPDGYPLTPGKLAGNPR